MCIPSPFIDLFHRLDRSCLEGFWSDGAMVCLFIGACCESLVLFVGERRESPVELRRRVGYSERGWSGLLGSEVLASPMSQFVV